MYGTYDMKAMCKVWNYKWILLFFWISIESTWNFSNIVIYVQFECIIVEMGSKHKHNEGIYNIVLWKFWQDQ